MFDLILEKAETDVKSDVRPRETLAATARLAPPLLQKKKRKQQKSRGKGAETEVMMTQYTIPLGPICLSMGNINNTSSRT
jgi:hypothetical protein